MEIIINLPEWIAYIGVLLIALWSADKTLLLIKKWYEWRIRKVKDPICDHQFMPKQSSDATNYCVCTKCGQHVK